MRSTLRHWLEEGPKNVRAPLAWAIGAAAIASVFAVVVMIVSYAPLNRENATRITVELPATKYDAVGVMIEAMGQSCERVCSVAPETSLMSSPTLDIACAPRADANGCLTPTHYRVSVEEAPAGPRR